MGVSVLVSPRHPHAVVMAPALTEANQPQSYNPLLLLDGCDLATIKPKSKRSSKDCGIISSDIEFNGTPPKRGRPLRPLEVVSSGADLSMNLSSPMGDQSDHMGLLKSNPTGSPVDGQENLNNFIKGNDMEQLLAVITPPNVDELMRAISTMESEASDNVDTGELELTGADIANLEAGLLMSGMDMMTGFSDEPLPEPAPPIKDTLIEEKLGESLKKQSELERNARRLQRRLKKLQARVLGNHVAEEVTGVLEKCARAVSIGGEGCSVSDLNRMLDKLHCSAYAQCQSGMRYRNPVRYFGSGSLEYPQSQDPAPGAVLPRLQTVEREELGAVVEQLHTDLTLVQEELDSDATESSSGGDSCDESVSHHNPLGHSLPIRKRAYWRWQQDRGAIASRWTWLINQIIDLDFKIRALTDHHRGFRNRRGTVTLATNPVSVNGYHGTLPGASVVKSQTEDPTSVCARTRPFFRGNFRKRVIFRTENLHQKSAKPKVTRASTVRCWCRPPATQCLVCTGRNDPTQQTAWPEPAGHPLPERIAALDPSYHPVLSFPHDVPLGLHLDSVMKLHEWQARTNRNSYKYNKSPKEKLSATQIRLKVESKKKQAAQAILSAKLAKRKVPGMRKRRRDVKTGDPIVPPITIKKARNMSSVSGGDSGDDVEMYVATSKGLEPPSPDTTASASGSTTEKEEVRKSRHKDDSYDIDNIVIPYSMAASTRVEMLPYKEIPTPKWRYVKCDEQAVEEEDEEDMSEEAVLERHARSQEAERKKFMLYMKLPPGGRGRATRRADSRAESSGANTPDPLSPMNAEPSDSPPDTPHPPAEDVASVLARRRTTSSSKTQLPRDRSLTPDPPDEVASYERRVYPLEETEVEAMMGSMRTSRRRKPDDLCDAGTPESPSSSSTISAPEVGEEPDDPNDPEWKSPQS